MPIIRTEEYRPGIIFRNNHINTIYPYFLRQRPTLPFHRKRIETPDGDFFDVDWLQHEDSDKLIVLLHGLEGSSKSQYIEGTAHVFYLAGYNVAAINFRSCSGELNRGFQLYHSGFTGDLEYFMDLYSTQFENLFLCGFSLGGSVVMNFMGKVLGSKHQNVRAAAGVSVPCDLFRGSLRLKKWYNYVYEKKFLTSLLQKMNALHDINPTVFPLAGIQKIRSLMEFDDHYTAPIHGFKDAMDYYHKCSCLTNLHKIERPTLLINAKDDSFLTPESFPHDIASNSDQFHLLTPRYGGHVGFSKLSKGPYWNELQILEFFNRYCIV